MRNADHLRISRFFSKASRARGSESKEILAIFMQLRRSSLRSSFSQRPGSFEELTHFGTERSRKILDSFRENIDPLALEITEIEDRIGID